MSLNVVPDFMKAVVAILDAHAGIAAITGRVSDNLRPWHDIADAPGVGLAYLMLTAVPVPAQGGTWRITVQFTAWARTSEECVGLLQVVDEQLRADNFLAHGVDAGRTPGVRALLRGPDRVSVEAGSASRGLGSPNAAVMDPWRADLDLVFSAKPLP